MLLQVMRESINRISPEHALYDEFPCEVMAVRPVWYVFYGKTTLKK
jgi:hypothetical protein